MAASYLPVAAMWLLLQVILAIGCMWLLCGILTWSGALPESTNEWGYQARVDSKTEVIHQAKWFRFPYPCV